MNVPIKERIWAKYRVGLKRELRRRGFRDINELSTPLLEQMYYLSKEVGDGTSRQAIKDDAVYL